jgi:fanconi anemia group J protein
MMDFKDLDEFDPAEDDSFMLGVSDVDYENEPAYEIVGDMLVTKIIYPRVPHNLQLQMAIATIRSVLAGGNCMQSIPTGGGKSLGYLCPLICIQNVIDTYGPIAAHDVRVERNSGNDRALDVYISLANNGPVKVTGFVVVVASRTHKQLDQLVGELNKTIYKSIPMCLLSSKEQVCVNPDVVKCRGTAGRQLGWQDIENLCEKLNGERSLSRCPCYVSELRNEEIYSQSFRRTVKRANNVEDYRRFGIANRACPYFGAKTLAQSSKLIFSPYNYIFDPARRVTIAQAVGLRGKKIVLVIDEAHNTIQACVDVASWSITMDELGKWTDHLGELYHSYDLTRISMQHKFASENLRSTLRDLDATLGTLWQLSDGKLLEIKGDPFYGSLCRSHLNAEQVDECTFNLAILCEKVNPIHPMLPAQDDDSTSTACTRTSDDLQHHNFKLKSGCKEFLSRMLAALSLYHSEVPNRKQDFTFFLEPAADGGGAYQISMKCLRAAVVFATIDAQSTVMVSGTLDPIEPFAAEIGCSFAEKISVTHHFDGVNDNLWAGVVAMSPGGGRLLECKHRNMQNPAFIDSLGDTLIHVLRPLHHGVLVFFTSYAALRKCIYHWSVSGKMAKIESEWAIFVELAGQSTLDYEQTLEAYRFSANNLTVRATGRVVRGAVFLAVCRGRISEGINFSDNDALAVIVVGVPFPAWKDTYIQAKMAYNDIRSAESGTGKPKLLNGDEFYRDQAARALNQVLGRGYRHPKDKVGVFLIDNRYTLGHESGLRNIVIEWIARKLEDFYNLDYMSSRVINFFK